MNNDLDKGAALEIMRYTVKTAAAPAVGGQAGAPAPTPGPLNPTGGATQGGSNNPQMQNGWAAGNMRKALVKRFTANSAKQMKQNVSSAAGRQNVVGGMGSGMPKMAAIGAQLSKASIEKTANPLLRALGAGVNLFSKGRAAAPAASKIINPNTGRVFGETAKAAPKLVDQFGRPLAAATTKAGPSLTRRAGEALGRVTTKAKDRISSFRKARGTKTKGPQYTEDLSSGQIGFSFADDAAKGGRNFLSKAGPYTESVAAPGAGRLARFKHWAAHRGSGFRNLYKNPETGKVIAGPRGFFRRTPKGYEKYKKFTETGGYLNRVAKKTLGYTALGGATGYGGSFVLNPGKFTNAQGKVTAKSIKDNLTDPRRLNLAKGVATLGIGSTIPGFAYTVRDTLTGGPVSKAYQKGYASGSALLRGKGGLMSAGPKNTARGASTYGGLLQNVGSTSTSKMRKKLDSDINKIDLKNAKDKAKNEKLLNKTKEVIQKSKTTGSVMKNRQDQLLASTRGRTPLNKTRPTAQSKPVAAGTTLAREAARTGAAPKTFTQKALARLTPPNSTSNIFSMSGRPRAAAPTKESAQVAALKARRNRLEKRIREEGSRVS